MARLARQSTGGVGRWGRLAQLRLLPNAVAVAPASRYGRPMTGPLEISAGLLPRTTAPFCSANWARTSSEWRSPNGLQN